MVVELYIDMKFLNSCSYDTEELKTILDELSKELENKYNHKFTNMKCNEDLDEDRKYHFYGKERYKFYCDAVTDGHRSNLVNDDDITDEVSAIENFGRYVMEAYIYFDKYDPQRQVDLEYT